MDHTFKCGLVKAFAAGSAPNWNEFAARVGFAQDKLGLNAVFLEAFKDESGTWLVPFFCVEGGMGEFAPVERTIAKTTPYKVAGLRTLDLTTADVDTLHTIATLLPEPAPAVKPSDVMPGPTKVPIQHPEEVFCDLVGMEEQKRTLMRLSNTVAKHGRMAIDCFHFVFTGNPGTGKTELAQRLSSYLDLLGITDGTGKFRKVGEADLVARYVGHTAPKVKQVIERSLGGVLFIDEFYAIANAPHFGQEAIDTLVDQIETHRDDFVCIIAGYTNKVDKALDLNPGLRGRFGFRIEFPDYTDEELGDIFVNMADKRGFEVEDRNILARCTAKLRSTRTFANARTMRNLVDKAIIEASNSHEGSQICGDDLLAATNELYERRGAVGF